MAKEAMILDDDAIKQLELKDNEMDDAINYLINNDKWLDDNGYRFIFKDEIRDRLN